MDDKERQTFLELQGKMVDHTSKLKTVQQQMAVLANNGRRAALTVEELATVPDTARTYRTVGRAYFLAPCGEVVDSLNEKQVSFSNELGRLKKSKAALEKGLKGVEGELRELLQSSPALAQQLMSRDS